MSVRKLPLVLSARARRDVYDILLFTRKQWGSAQRSEYRRLLFQGFSELQTFPNMGLSREDLAPELRCFPLGRHMVYYHVRDADLFVNRILHVNRDIVPGDLVDPYE